MKSMKKLVLAGLVLLASVMVLVGCKNDSVPEVPKYTVKFETKHGTAPASITVESGTKLTTEQLKALPDTEDNIFEGWYDGETQAKGGEYTVTKDVTLVARWRNRDTVDSVTFSSSDTKFYYGEMVTVTLATATEGARIHYQLGEGKWEIYEKPFTVSSETVVTAYATKDGLKDSEKTKSNYLRQLISITVTPPTRTVYSVGESFDGSGMVVTATYDDGKERTVEGTITSETSSLTESAGINKGVTVSYTEGANIVTATFTVDVASYQFTETVQAYEYPEGKTGTASGTTTPTVETPVYKKFGDWPQTIKGADVIVGSGTLVRGGLIYHVGDDGDYYVKHKSEYYKVEPIIWRVLNSKDGEYNKSENPLLLAEKILTGGIPYYVDENERTITGAGTALDAPNTVYPNNYKYSTIRAWLNGKYEDDDTQEQNKAYKGIGFLQTAFTEKAQKEIIVDTEVDNSARSTSDAEEKLSQATDYACVNTTDKIFLLSEQEATMSDYGFGVYDASGQGNTRIRVTTDYAKATGAYQSSAESYGGWWWLRSPDYINEDYARRVRHHGNAFSNISVRDNLGGVVPALSISLQ